MTFYIKIADKLIQIQSLYEKIYTWCKDYLATQKDLSETTANMLTIKITPEDLQQEDHAIQYHAWKKHPESIMIYHPAHLEVYAVYRKICEIMPLHATFLMHGSVIATGGRGYMFTAPSGTGKTTRTKLWQKEYPASVIVNGDKPLLRVTSDQVYAYGTPWAGKEGENSNICVPLQTIFLLERAEYGTPNMIQKLHSLEAIPFLVQQTYHPRNLKALEETLELLQTLTQTVDLYKLRCTPSSEAIRLACETARPKEEI